MALLTLSSTYTARRPHVMGGTTERVHAHLLVQGSPAVELHVELVRYEKHGHCAGLEVYLTSRHSQVPTFVGYAERQGTPLWERLFYEAQGAATGRW